jgi:uncharacterized protein YecT (DUF1311 family)
VKTRIGCFSVCLLSGLLLVGRSCFAQHMNAKDGPCQVPSSTAEETACFADALKRSDSQLNQMYRRVQSVVSGDDLVNLRTAQRLWMQFRDANCEAEHELYSGGSAAPMVKLACLEALTKHRKEELTVMYGWRLEKWGK